MAKREVNEIHLSSDKCLGCDMCKIIIPYQLHVESIFFLFNFTKSLTLISTLTENCYFGVRKTFILAVVLIPLELTVDKKVF